MCKLVIALVVLFAVNYAYGIAHSERSASFVQVVHHQPSVAIIPKQQIVVANEFRRPVVANEFRRPVVANEFRRPIVANEFRRPVVAIEERQPVVFVDHRVRPVSVISVSKPAVVQTFIQARPLNTEFVSHTNSRVIKSIKESDEESTEPVKAVETRSKEINVQTTEKTIETIKNDKPVEKSVEEKIIKSPVKVKKPIVQETSKPIVQETRKPVVQETRKPVVQETRKPVVQETRKPVVQEIRKPVVQEIRKPVVQETRKPVNQEARKSVVQETRKPVVQETRKPVVQEIRKPVVVLNTKKPTVNSIKSFNEKKKFGETEKRELEEPSEKRESEEHLETRQIEEQEPEKKQVVEQEPEKKQVVEQEPEKKQVLEQEPEKKQVLEQEPEKKQVLEQEPEKKQIEEQEPEKKQIVEQEPEKKQVVEQEPETKQVLEQEHSENKQVLEEPERIETTKQAQNQQEQEQSKEQSKRSVEVSNKSEKKESTEQNEISALCDSISNFKYYISYPSDTSKYIQCNPWGTYKVLSCDTGLIWDSWQLKCETVANVQNVSTTLWRTMEKLLRPNVTFNCNKPEFKCQNNGICLPTDDSNGFRCQCAAHFSGDLCEIQIDFSYVYQDIINGTFSLSQYESSVVAENITFNLNTSYYEQYRTELGNAIYTNLIQYLQQFNSTQVRYDILVKFLVGDILKDLYPDAFYLYQFNASAQSVVSMLHMMPNLLSYARYSNDRYELVLDEYQRCLERAVALMQTERPKTASLQATQYITLVNQFVNRSMVLMNQTINQINDHDFVADIPVESKEVVNNVELKSQMRNNFNNTLQMAYKLIQTLSEFQRSVTEEMQKDTTGSIYKLTLGASKLPGTEQALELFDNISKTSIQTWESLTTYGFWFITNSLASPLNATTPITTNTR